MTVSNWYKFEDYTIKRLGRIRICKEVYRSSILQTWYSLMQQFPKCTPRSHLRSIHDPYKNFKKYSKLIFCFFIFNNKNILFWIVVFIFFIYVSRDIHWRIQLLKFGPTKWHRRSKCLGIAALICIQLLGLQNYNFKFYQCIRFNISLLQMINISY